MTSPAIISPTTDGTKATLPGTARRAVHLRLVPGGQMCIRDSYIYYNVRDSQLHQILGATAFCRIMSASVTVALPSPFMSARAS